MINQWILTSPGKRHSKRLVLAYFFLVSLLFAACSPDGSAQNQSELPVKAADGPVQIGAELTEDQHTPEDPSSSGGITTSISGVDPCELLTAAEVEAVVGEPFSSAEEPDIGNYLGCQYQSLSPGKFIILQVTQQSAERFRKDNEETAAFFETELLPVENLGDEAAFYSGLLRVRAGELVFQIASWHTEAELDQAFEITQELARFAVMRLP